MTENIIIAGFGGQGVLSLGQFLAYAAMYENKEATWLPSYGPEMRGGTANCSLVISDKPIASPVIETPDTLIALNKPSLDKFIDNVKTGGAVIVNSSIIKDKIERDDIKVIYLPANDVAAAAGSVKTANVVVLGAYIAATKLFSKESVRATIEKIFKKKSNVIPMNLAAFELGYAAIDKECK
ncbi:MAG: 2-oxoacid:acceptor oxidoreductase family protein [Clostridiales bacterium]|jgi:2-oxoglutarate ferredoxin oxidoreductase subunit gamma|nr:2-oxoacid:acceptor oxidoreductase family protein [Clostridiales bacterium]